MRTDSASRSVLYGFVPGLLAAMPVARVAAEDCANCTRLAGLPANAAGPSADLQGRMQDKSLDPAFNQIIRGFIWNVQNLR